MYTRWFMELLKLKNVNLSYKTEIVSDVLKNVNVEISEGEFIAVMGPSGAGKSSLLYVMSGLEIPDSGEVLLKGKNICELSQDKMADIRLNNFGFVYQFFNLIPTLSVEENIVFPLKIAKKNMVEYKSKVDNIIDKVGLSDKRGFKPSQLSGGQQQRVAIARALINEPQIIFADEPTGSLDYGNSMEVMELLQNLCKESKTTVVMVTHNQELCKFASRVIKIVDGKIHS